MRRYIAVFSDLDLISDVCLPIVQQNNLFAFRNLNMSKLKNHNDLKTDDESTTGANNHRLSGLSSDKTKDKTTNLPHINSEEFYRTIFEHTATANMILAEDTTVLFVNENFEKMMGYSKEEVENKLPWTKFVVEEDVELMKQRHLQRRTAPASVPTTYEFRGLTKTGEIRHIFLSVDMIPGTANSVASLFDITEHKKSQEAARHSEERFKDMVRLLPETVFETDVDGKITFFNELSFSRFGFTQDDLDRGLYIQDVLAPQEHEYFKTVFQDVVRGQRVELKEMLAQKKDGETFPALVRCAGILINGEPAGIRGFLIDITEKKTLENQLLHAEKLKAIGTLAGGIAHDFNNLLMGILGNLTIMLMHMGGAHPFYDRLKVMEDYVHRGSSLTRQLLGFARGGKYEVRPTDMGKFVIQSAEMFGRTKKDISIQLEIGESLWHVDVDRGQMDQVLLNLFVNAWQAMPDGGNLYISVKNVELSKKEMNALGTSGKRFVKITVSDTGAGMDEKIMSRVFEPFFTTKEQSQNTGMGLASAYGIIRNHGGYIQVESRPGRGTSFIIYLPPSNHKAQDEPQKESRIYKGTETILLIDDEQMIIDVASRILEELGYKVLSATSAKKGIEIFQNSKEIINLVVLDMIMPGISGKEAFDILRQADPSVKVLLSSGFSVDSQAKDIMAAGCRGFIQKPFTMAQLSQKVRQILDGDLPPDNDRLPPPPTAATPPQNH